MAVYCKLSLFYFSNIYVAEMIHSSMKDKSTRLLIFFTAFFVANALIAECIGGKIFSLEKVFGLVPSQFELFGQKDFPSILPAAFYCGRWNL